ncbi:hypothetical protein ACFQ45_11375 [Rhodanobacter aciditrophus]|uniref:Uncharacterized protein n=1 Tax=Rhodanobacter aciditrophus TaxID=1623218 RepID=A0ABW4B228_9GAMM
MKRLLIFILLLPLMLFVSAGSHASEDCNAPSYLKTGLVETAFELPTVEVAPDLDDVLVTSHNPLGSSPSTFKVSIAHFCAVSDAISLFTCRGPPTA